MTSQEKTFQEEFNEQAQKFVEHQIKYIELARENISLVKSRGINPVFAEVEYAKAKSTLDQFFKLFGE